MSFEVSYVDADALQSASSSRQQPLRSKSKVLKEELISYVVNGTKSCLWYSSSQRDISKEVLEIITEFSLGTSKDIDFLAKTLIFSREACYISHISIIGLAILSCSPFPAAKEAFRKIFDKVIKDGEDLKLFMEVIMSKVFRGFGKTIQKSLIKWLQNHLTPFNVIAWGTDNRVVDSTSSRRRTNSFKLSDIARLAHIKGRTAEELAMYTYITRGIISAETPVLLKNWQSFLSNTTTSHSKINLIKDNGFPINKVREHSRASEITRELFLQADFNDIITNINTYQQAGVFEVASHLNRLINVLVNKDAVIASKLTPFDFIKAHDTYSGTDIKVFSALEKASEIAYNNLPKINGKVTIILDQSVNMLQSTLQNYPNISTLSVATTLASIIAKMCKNECTIISFANRANRITITPTIQALNTLQFTERLNTKQVLGERDYKTPFELLNRQIDVQDHLICLSNTSWISVLRNTGAGNELTAFTNGTGKNTKMLFWQLNTSNEQHVTNTLPNTVFVDGVDTTTVNFVTKQLSETMDYLSYVSKIEI